MELRACSAKLECGWVDICWAEQGFGSRAVSETEEDDDDEADETLLIRREGVVEVVSEDPGVKPPLCPGL